MSARGQCPSCGGQVEFRFEQAFVVTCTYCGSTVARTDRGLEDLGKHSDVVASESSLEPFRKGVYRGVPFTLMGRLVLAHPKGGRWSEWYAALENGTVGWLSEAQGVFTMLEAHADDDSLAKLRWETLTVGATVSLAGRSFVVSERSTKTALAAEGEVPFVPAFDRPEPFVDLTAEGGFVATLDFQSQPPELFVGRCVRLDELGLEVRAGRRDAREVTAASLACGNCGGPIRLHAPDATRRVTCAACGSLHEVEGTTFRFLETLEQGVRPAIALGKRFHYASTQWQIVGWMERSVTSQGIRYPWQEYLAYDASEGFRYLVESKGHWLWATPDPASGRGVPSDSQATVEDKGTTYRLFAHDQARVDAVAGEFPWAVAIGETCHSFDYVAPPFGLSCELDEGEVQWSRAEGLEAGAVAAMFPGVTLPATSGVGMLAPNPYRGLGQSLRRGLLAAFVLLVIAVVLRPTREVLDQSFVLPPRAAVSPTEGVVVVTPPFELHGSRRITVDLKATPPLYAYADIVGDLLDVHDVVVDSFRAASYSDLDDDGAPTGQAEADVALGHVEPGTYRLRLDVIASSAEMNDIGVRIREGGVPWGGFFFALLVVVLLGIPFFVLRGLFESRRYAASDFSPSGRRLEGNANEDAASDDDSDDHSPDSGTSGSDE